MQINAFRLNIQGVIQKDHTDIHDNVRTEINLHLSIDKNAEYEDVVHSFLTMKKHFCTCISVPTMA